MTKENGYQKRDREIRRLRSVIEDCGLDLQFLSEHPNSPNMRSRLLNWVEKLTHALNKRGDR